MPELSCLGIETRDACYQLTRYGAVFNTELMDILNTLVELNDDLHNMLAEDLILENIDTAQMQLDILRKQVIENK